MQYGFQMHTGEHLETSDQRLIAACENVAAWYEQNARDVLEENAYASHVTESTKMERFYDQFHWASLVRMRQNLNNFSVWQRVNSELTGECVAFLPK